MHTFFSEQIVGNQIFLPPDESHHCSRVLRLKPADRAGVLDGLGSYFVCRITEVHPTKTVLEILNKDYFPPDPYYIHIAIAPVKNPERMEWFLEKAVELGIHEITFLTCHRSEKTNLKYPRLNKKAISALKQSGHKYMPKINQIIHFRDFISGIIPSDEQLFLANTQEVTNHLVKKAEPGKKYMVVIGPEGDFTKEEMDTALSHGFSSVSLGKSILRTETAGLTALHTLIILNQQ